MNVTLPKKEKLNIKAIIIYTVSIMACIVAIIVIGLSAYYGSEELDRLITVGGSNISQKDIDYQYKILSYTDELCIINWQMTRTLMPSNIRQQIDGIFQISVNEEGKCTYFKQWRYTR